MSLKPLEPGVWAILATPFKGDGLEVDTASIATLVAMYRNAGAKGLVALGVLGEAARLSSAERQSVLSTVVDASGGLPVVCGMAALATAPAVEEAERAAAAGARAVMVQVASGDAAVLAAHLQRISAASGLGIVLQDHPASSGITITPAALSSAARDAGCVVAVKAEAPPTAPTIAAVRDELEIPMFGGLGGVALLDELLAGSSGAMTGFAVPEALVATVSAWNAGGFAAAREVYAPWLPLVIFEAIERVGLAVRKEILRRRGVIAESKVRPPGAQLPASLAALLDAHLSAVDMPA
jgi:4-hydroxy-tetrahydrodipicolinate synthase